MDTNTDTNTTPAPHLPTAELLAAATAGYRAEDPLYLHPYLDVDEVRESPTPHRYLHGGFTDTALKFSIYLPPHHRYAGRFFQPVLPISGFENASTMGMLDGMAGTIGFAHDSGAILVESNMGTPTPHPGDDPTIPGFRASAATARFARSLAAVVYGPHRAYGYVYGGSGGAFKTIACVENAPDVWDGAVPFVQGSPVAIPNVFAVQAHAMRVLAGKWPQIVDAIEPGGSGNMYEGLDVEEREALAEATRFGFPPRAWFDVQRIRSGYTAMWGAFAAGIKGLDPEYFRDFWTVPGYLGADAPASLRAAHVDRRLTVAALIGTTEAAAAGLPVSMAQQLADSTAEEPVALRFADLPDIDLFGASLTIVTGPAAGRTLLVNAVTNGIVSLALAPGATDALAGITVGDEVHLDNSDYLAFQTLHRHQVAKGYDGFDQFVVDGTPKYPQRPRLVGPALARGSWGHQQTGRFRVKMIALASMLDESAFPWKPDWYRRRVFEAQGPAAADHYRLWYIDHAMHGEPSPVVVAGDVRPARLARTISYNGALEQAVRDVVQWVEQGIAPAPDTNYTITDAQVTLHGGAAERGGIQPVVGLTANGAVRADVAVGEAVEFVGTAATPADLGRIVRAEWDFEGDATYEYVDATVDGSLGSVTVRITHSFATPGVYFPVLRITAHRQGFVDSPYARVQNLGRVRVVVS